MLESNEDHREITGGIDTHADTHTVAALDELGRLLGHSTFPATSSGYAELLAWLAGHEPSRPAPRLPPPKPVTGSLNPSGHCGRPAMARSRPAPPRSTRCAKW